MKQLTAILVGAGMRSTTYASFALQYPEMLKIVGVADPLENKRENIKKLHNIPDDKCFTDWKDLLAQPKFADFAIIGTQDNMHYEPAMVAIEKKYDLLLEKPISPSPEECLKIADSANANNVKVVVCHVLRFTAIFKRIKALIMAGKLGDIMTVEHTEAVGHIHQSHSFVRGNWRNSIESSPMILAKSCHDTDILAWLINKPCKKVQSFGHLSFFTHENRPSDAPDRCIQGCPHAEKCRYNAVKLYLEDEENSWFRTAAANKVDPTNADIEEALREGPYGRCVYACDNDVVDHQTVNMEFEGGVTAVFTMAAFNAGGRFIRIMGTKGDLTANIDKNTIDLFDFDDNYVYHIDPNVPDPELDALNGVNGVNCINGTDGAPASEGGSTIVSGHGGGDEGIIIDLCKYLNGEYTGHSICNIDGSAESHLIAFAAERSRTEGIIVDMDKYATELSNKI